MVVSYKASPGFSSIANSLRDSGSEPKLLSAPHQVPKGPAKAYDGAQRMNATLSFLVPTISLLSCIPAALAWSHALPKVGTVRDADFYQLVSTSAMQVLGIITLVWPTLYHARLARLSWIWTWILAIVSTGCTLAALSLYALLPTSWSALFSFGGSVAQALVTLQLVYSIST